MYTYFRYYNKTDVRANGHAKNLPAIDCGAAESARKYASTELRHMYTMEKKLPNYRSLCLFLACSLDFQRPFLPILPVARILDIDLSCNGQPRRAHTSAPYNLNILVYKHPGSPVWTCKEPRRRSTPRPTGTCNFIPRDDLLYCAPGSFRII
ncbi:hypothetical protein EVAR_98801_1 [Eumeta japonica]|uniref:Uncharacterized protein n=1 Tax=Eumeta variegata TaxID=151549 RepID=A0A4C1XX90_EUMVA|nr:hypothetical protein EVAR_98801_1 [Eumeta japonica]